ncbi:hypothetical protein GCM10027282_22930 [Frigoribacterium salinisoli]
MTHRPASACWRAEAVPTRRPGALVLLRWLPSVAGALFFGAGGTWRGTDVVVREIDGSRDVLRLVGKDGGEAEDALQLLRADLDRFSQEDFLREWGAAEEPGRHALHSRRPVGEPLPSEHAGCRTGRTEVLCRGGVGCLSGRCPSPVPSRTR